jgi:hypothetical protein
MPVANFYAISFRVMSAAAHTLLLGSASPCTLVVHLPRHMWPSNRLMCFLQPCDWHKLLLACCKLNDSVAAIVTSLKDLTHSRRR